MPDENSQAFSVSRDFVPPLHNSNGGTNNVYENSCSRVGVENLRDDEIGFMGI
jgi:hypothetical protein